MSRRGFTLIEMLVVVAIILVLMGLMGVAIPYLIEKARYANTAGLVKNLDTACQNYHTGSGVFPPDDRGGSKSLHYHLGRPREVNFDGTLLKRDPVWEIPAGYLRTVTDPEVQPSEIVDAWENEIGYANPGKDWKPSGVEIWSKGRNGVAELDPDARSFDDVTNWTKEH